MPTLTRDWQEQARTLISAGMGVRQAARELGLPEDRVRQWALRSGVCKAVAAAQATIALSPESPLVATAADILAKQGPDTRSKLSIGINRAAAHISEMSGPDVLEQSTAVLQVTKAGSVLHSWQEQTPGQQVMVNVNLLGVELPVVEQIQSSSVAIADLADIVEQANPQV